MAEISRQRKWQIAKLAAGKCSKCGKKRNLYAIHCDICAVVHRVLMRARMGSSPYKVVKLGKKPFLKEKT